MSIDINEINHTNVILNIKYITYSVLFQLCPPKVLPVSFASNLSRIPKRKCLRSDINDRIYVHATSQGLVLIQRGYGYHTR